MSNHQEHTILQFPPKDRHCWWLAMFAYLVDSKLGSIAGNIELENAFHRFIRYEQSLTPSSKLEPLLFTHGTMVWKDPAALPEELFGEELSPDRPQALYDELQPDQPHALIISLAAEVIRLRRIFRLDFDWSERLNGSHLQYSPPIEWIARRVELMAKHSIMVFSASRTCSTNLILVKDTGVQEELELDMNLYEQYLENSMKSWDGNAKVCTIGPPFICKKPIQINNISPTVSKIDTVWKTLNDFWHG